MMLGHQEGSLQIEVRDSVGVPEPATVNFSDEGIEIEGPDTMPIIGIEWAQLRLLMRHPAVRHYVGGDEDLELG
jgi:hypothetical protein